MLFDCSFWLGRFYVKAKGKQPRVKAGVSWRFPAGMVRVWGVRSWKLVRTRNSDIFVRQMAEWIHRLLHNHATWKINIDESRDRKQTQPPDCDCARTVLLSSQERFFLRNMSKSSRHVLYNSKVCVIHYSRSLWSFPQPLIKGTTSSTEYHNWRGANLYWCCWRHWRHMYWIPLLVSFTYPAYMWCFNSWQSMRVCYC